MKCKKAKKLLSLYFDGELMPEVTGQVAGHLDICLGCSEEFRGLGLIHSLLAGDAPAVPSQLFWEGVKARIAEGREPAREEAPPRIKLVYALALTGLLVGGLTVSMLMEAGRLVTISDYLRSALPRQGRTHLLLSDREVTLETVLRLTVLPEQAFAGEIYDDDF